MIEVGTEVIVKHVAKTNGGDFIIARSVGKVVAIIHSSVGPLYTVEYNDGRPPDLVSPKGIERA